MSALTLNFTNLFFKAKVKVKSQTFFSFHHLVMTAHCSCDIKHRQTSYSNFNLFGLGNFFQLIVEIKKLFHVIVILYFCGKRSLCIVEVSGNIFEDTFRLLELTSSVVLFLQLSLPLHFANFELSDVYAYFESNCK